MSGICPCTIGNSVSKALFNLRDAKKLNQEEPEQSAIAVVTGRNVQHNNTMYHEDPWQYVVSFLLETGETVSLRVSQMEYGPLKEDTRWKITWKGERLLGFEKI